jgi:hypothetical protein
MKSMRKLQRTRIQNLAAIGDELSEQHLRLASGGRPVSGASHGRAPTYRNGEMVDSCTDPILR